MALTRSAWLGVLLLWPLSGATANPEHEWPPLPSQLVLETPYGTLNIQPSEYVYESRLRIDNQPTEPPIVGLLNITYAFQLPDARSALVSISDGNSLCPISYRWVILNKQGYTISPPFGSCSTHIRVSVNGHKYTVHTPSSQAAGKIDRYVYDGKTIHKRTITARKAVARTSP